MLGFDTDAIEELTHARKVLDWQTRLSSDDAFLFVNAKQLANEMVENGDDLSTLRADTLATAIQLHCAKRFSTLGSQSAIVSDGLERAIDLIHASLPQTVSLTEMIAISGLSRQHLLAGFRSRTGTSPHQYIIRERLARAQFLFRTTTRCVSEIAQDVGCANAEHLGKMFRQHLKISPRAWQLKNNRRR